MQIISQEAKPTCDSNEYKTNVQTKVNHFILTSLALKKVKWKFNITLSKSMQ